MTPKQLEAFLAKNATTSTISVKEKGGAAVVVRVPGHLPSRKVQALTEGMEALLEQATPKVKKK
jgi:hypothetical protein